MEHALIDLELPALNLVSKGKVRHLYENDGESLLFVTTDRISAFDVVLANGIPFRGVILNRMTQYWMSLLADSIPNLKTHYLNLDTPGRLDLSQDAALIAGRCMQVRKLKVLPIESIVRGYITGSAWAEYIVKCTVHGISMPPGLQESQELPSPLWTPSTKAKAGEKDENISPHQAAQILGQELADKIAELSVAIYNFAREHALERGIIIADTKFEFGLDESTNPPTLVLVDEVLTPDSSRFWDASKYKSGAPQPSYDKQILRNWLAASGLEGKTDVILPSDVIKATQRAYVNAYERLCNRIWHPQRVLLIGNGAREHALAWKIAQSPNVEAVFVCPGNGGTSEIPKTVNVTHVSPQSFADLAAFTHEQNINLLVPGSEQSLVDGIADYFVQHDPQVKCFGPTRQAANLEGSKVFAKDFMQRHNIPTARYKAFSNFDEAKAFIDSAEFRPVIKADGLAAGKGVVLPETKEAAYIALQQIMQDKCFGVSGSTVVIEEFLEGHEVSLLSLCDGDTTVTLLPAQDHKRIFDNDQGPNTGGMGTYSPVPEHIVDTAMLEEIETTILGPTIRGMSKEGAPFRGCLFAGLMITESGPRLLEYNVRFGDPETQSVLARMDVNCDLAALLMSCAQGRLDGSILRVQDKAAATIVLAAPGYPNAYPKGLPITLSKTPDGVTLFHAGTTKNEKGNLVTAGGRVMSVTAIADSLGEAVNLAYQSIECVHFEGMQYRKDIASQALWYAPALRSLKATQSITRSTDIPHSSLNLETIASPRTL